jgi:outer membrane immunogenic protein
MGKLGAVMRKLFLASVAFVALNAASSVLAADMRTPVYKAQPAYTPVPVFSWTGCYIGVHAGGGWQVSSYTTEGGADSGVGALGGAQVGCNGQWRQFVIGLEGEFWGSTLHDRSYFQNENFTDDRYSRNRWDGAISVRSGVAFDRAFVYGKLGVVWGKFDYTTDGSSIFQVFNTSTQRGDAIFTGVLIGAGFEYALTDNWTTKFEYNYIDYGNKVVTLTDVVCFVSEPCFTRTPSNRTIKEVKQIAKLGINYKFDWGKGPVVARY